MTTIYKYGLRITGEQVIHMPLGARMLTAQMQDGDLFVWAMVDTAQPLEKVCFRIFGTGQELGALGDIPYLGTVQDGGLVWHVFYTRGALWDCPDRIDGGIEKIFVKL